MEQILPSSVIVKTGKSKYHTFEQHNYWIRRNRVCPYCNSGSIAVHKSILLRELHKFDKNRTGGEIIE